MKNIFGESDFFQNYTLEYPILESESQKVHIIFSLVADFIYEVDRKGCLVAV